MRGIHGVRRTRSNHHDTTIKEIGMFTLYTVSYLKAESKTQHGSKDGETTVCGKELNHNWFITNNTFDGTITCKKCLELLRNKL